MHRRDRVGIEAADRGQVDRETPADLHCVRAPVLRFFVVEECVRPRGEDLVREHRRFGGVDGVHTHRARLHALEQLAQSVDVERIPHTRKVQAAS